VGNKMVHSLKNRQNFDSKYSVQYSLQLQER
jgi:hypothetical protein